MAFGCFLDSSKYFQIDRCIVSLIYIYQSGAKAMAGNLKTSLSSYHPQQHMHSSVGLTFHSIFRGDILFVQIKLTREWICH